MNISRAGYPIIHLELMKEAEMARASLYMFKRQSIVEAIQRLSLATGRSPSMREIADITDVSIGTLHSYLRQMREEGIVEWQERSHRSLRVIRPLPAVTNELEF